MKTRALGRVQFLEDAQFGVGDKAETIPLGTVVEYMSKTDWEAQRVKEYEAGDRAQGIRNRQWIVIEWNGMRRFVSSDTLKRVREA